MTTITTRSGKGSPLTNDEVDANFTNLNTDKVETSGDSMTGNLSFGDNVRLTLGDKPDLLIYHDGSESIIRDNGAGNLNLRGNSVSIANSDASKSFIEMNNGSGAVELYCANVEKLATTSTGIDVTGVITTDGMTTSADINFGDNDKAVFGAGSDLQIYHDGSNSFVEDTGTGALFAKTNGTGVFLYSGSEALATFNTNGASNLYYDNALKLSTTSTGIDVTGTVTADGLTVDGDVEISSTAPLLNFLQTDTTDKNAQLRINGNNFFISRATDAGSVGSTIATFNVNSGDISFYEDTGTTAKLFWDASAERLGIGNSSPTDAITILDSNNSTTGQRIKIGYQSSDFNYTIGRNTSTGHLDFIGTNSAGSSLIGYNFNGIITANAGASFGAGIDVTGTVTADGLAIAASSPNLSVQGNSATDASLTLTSAGITSWALRNESTDSSLHFTQDGTNRAKLSSGGDISFYEDTGTTAKLFWDASEEKLGVGESNPSDTLELGGGNIVNPNSTGSEITSATLGIGQNIHLEERQVNGAYSDRTDLAIVTNSGFGLGESEKIRIEAGGNVGIGTSSPNSYSSQTTLTINGSTYGRLDLESAGTLRASLFATTGSASLTTSTDVLSFDTSGGEAMRIDASGNVGIGTTNTTFVNGVGLKIADATAARLILTDSTNGVGSEDGLQFTQSGTNAYFNLHENGFMAFNTNNTERMRLDSSGQLLLGRGANVASGAEATRIQFYNTASTYDTASIRSLIGAGQVNRGELSFAVNNGAGQQERMRLDYSGNVLVGMTSASTTVDGLYLRPGTNSGINASSSHALTLNRRTNDGTIIKFDKDGTTVGSIGSAAGGKMSVIGTNQNLQIGANGANVFNVSTTSIYPATDNATDLGFSSSIRFKDLYLSGTANASVFTSSATVADVTVRSKGSLGNLILDTENSNGLIQFKQAGSEKMRLDAGNLLVGTTDTVIWNDTSGEGVVIGPNAIQVARASDTCLLLNRQSTDGILQVFASRGVQVGSVSVTTTATTYNTSSDQRLKENIVDAPSASDDIDAIQVRSFDWKADGSHQKYGMVAQELQSVAPEAVTGDADSDDMMGVDYSKLVPMMLKEIQSLRARVAQLEGAN